MNKEKKYGVWTKYFASGVDWDFYNLIKLHAQRSVDLFMQGVDLGHIKVKDDLTPDSQNPELDRWVSENDHILTELVYDIQKHVLAIAEYALPAHDERQFMFKDASEGLRYCMMEKPQGYKATFPISMFAHDSLGRSYEGFYYDPVNNPTDNWIPHAQMSFLMLKDILDQPKYGSMPRLLKDHHLYAVLAHSGDNAKSYMSRAVQSCDRMQLIGAEGFYRALGFVVCLKDADIKYPDDDSYNYNLPSMYEHRSVLSILEYCARNMRENIGDEHRIWQHRIAVENVVLLKAACEGNDELAKRIFAPELSTHGTFGHLKRKIDPVVLQDANHLYASTKNIPEIRWSPYEVASAAIQAIEMPVGAAKLSDSMKKSIHRAVGDMSDVERKSLFLMMSLADQFRAEQDDIDRDVSLVSAKDQKQFIRAIADATRGYTRPSSDLGFSTVSFPLNSFSPSCA